MSYALSILLLSALPLISRLFMFRMPHKGIKYAYMDQPPSPSHTHSKAKTKYGKQCLVQSIDYFIYINDNAHE